MKRDLGSSVYIHRRAFLSSCSALVLALAGCGPFLSRTRFARLALNDPHPDDYRPVLDALIRTILPFDHPQFPRIPSQAIVSRFLSLFPLEAERRYLVLQNGLMIFDQVDLFPLLQAPIASEERALLSAVPSVAAGQVDAAIADKALQDQRLYAAFLRTSLPSGAGPFTALDGVQRTGYLRLWGQSGFNSKRLFYQASKRLVMVTAYSMEESWPTIGYAGPLLSKKS